MTLTAPGGKTTTTPSPRLPHGLRVRLVGTTIVTPDATALVGGSPLTVLRLSPLARTYLVDRAVEVIDANSAHLADRLLDTNLAQPDLALTPPVDPAEITVVIPVRDRAIELGRALTSLAGLRCVVVDDASTHSDVVAEVARAHDAELVALPRNLGPAGARNAGLDHVTSRYVAFVDSDIEVEATTLTHLARHFADPAVAMVGPKILGRSQSAHPRWFEAYDAAASSLTLGDTAAVVRPGTTVGWLPSACLVARTQLVRDRLHGFDPAMRMGEDVDLVWRLVAAGHRVRYDPAAQAHHAIRGTLRTWLGRKYLYGTGGAPLAAKHGAAAAPAILTPLSALTAAALLTRTRWAVPLALANVALGTRTMRRHLPADHARDLTAVRFATRGLGWAVRQESALLLRHWWPLTLLASAHPVVRRATLTAVAVDTFTAAWERRHHVSRPSPGVTLLARRLDDLAYGAGLWAGALRARSLQPLRPRRP